MKHLSFPIIFCFLILTACKEEPELKPPNIVIIFLDDSGWSDFQPFGEDKLETPHLAQLAREGCSYMNFYVPQVYALPA